jgi:tRNA threonylcarbamoyladenosine biosynthesis protein TsaB
MRVLALDSTSQTGSVALVDEERIIAERLGDPNRPHAERLPTDLLLLIDAVGVPLSSIDLFAVAAGPGSFTGLRIGIATMQGFAVVERKPIVAVSALEAVAHAVAGDVPEGTHVGVWIDAHRRDVFSALYRVTAAPVFTRERLIELDSPAVGNPSATFARWVERFGPPAVIAGDGAASYADRVDDAVRMVAFPCLAGTVGLVGAARARAGEAVNAASVRPLYVRRPDAEIARDTSARQDTESPDIVPRRPQR